MRGGVEVIKEITRIEFEDDTYYKVGEEEVTCIELDESNQFMPWVVIYKNAERWIAIPASKVRWILWGG